MFLSNPSIPIYSSFPYNLALRETKEEKKKEFKKTDLQWCL